MRKWVKVSIMITGIVIGVLGAIMYSRSISYPDSNNSKTLIKSAVKNKENVVIVFHKTGCSDCEAIKGTVKKTIKDNRDHIRYIVVDLKKSQNRYLIKQFNLTSTPTIMQLHNGREYRRYEGTDNDLVKDILKGE